MTLLLRLSRGLPWRAFCRGRALCRSHLLQAINFAGAFPFSCLLPCGLPPTRSSSTQPLCAAPSPSVPQVPHRLATLCSRFLPCQSSPSRLAPTAALCFFSPFLHLQSCQKAECWLKRSQIHVPSTRNMSSFICEKKVPRNSLVLTNKRCQCKLIQLQGIFSVARDGPRACGFAFGATLTPDPEFEIGL